MTKSQLINYISEEAEVPRKTAQKMIEALGECAYREAKRGFTLPGLGKLVLVNRKARTGFTWHTTHRACPGRFFRKIGSTRVR